MSHSVVDAAALFHEECSPLSQQSSKTASYLQRTFVLRKSINQCYSAVYGQTSLNIFPVGGSRPDRSTIGCHYMYRCQICSCVVPPRTPSHRIVVKQRAKKYPYRKEANRVIQVNENGKLKEKKIDDSGGKGQEIAEEIIVCPECASKQAS